MQCTRGELPCRFGKYVLIERVAEGGMAEILLALEELPFGGRRIVTIKRIRQEFESDPDYVDFFLNEGRVSLQCSHPNLPHVFELGKSGGGFFLSMEYIHGRTLLDILRGAIRVRHRPSVPSVVAVGSAIASALEHAHGLRDCGGASLRVVHRDVTPQNIMVTTDGTVKLIDFGIVRSAVQLHKTATGIVKGKFAYMAPEQLEERPAIDRRADIFALGIVLWEALAARPLMRGRSELDTIDRIRRMPIPDLSRLRDDVPTQLTAVINKALERKPNRRFQSAGEMLRALEKVACECGIVSSRTRLRDEMAGFCGLPEVPEIPDLSNIPEEQPAETTDVHSQITAVNDGAGAVLAAIKLTRRDATERQESGLDADPLLRYYLRQATAQLPPSGSGPIHDVEPAAMEQA